MSHVPDVSVVICAYTEQRWEALLASVASVRQQHYAPCEIIVVVDHNPALFERVRACISDVVAIENTQARGLSGARNSGIAMAQGSVIAFMDEDAVASSDWLMRLVAHYADAQVIGVGGAIEPLWLDGRPGWFPNEFDWVVGCTYRGMPETSAQVRNVIGCNMSFRRDVFSAVGGFRDGIGRIGTLPVGCEETELCIRIRQHWPHALITYEPQARVAHRVPTSRSRWDYFRSRCYSEGISKALVAQFVGTQDGLSSERAYTLRTLPTGVLHGFGEALRGSPMGVMRAFAIVLGFMFTVMGYLVGRMRGRLPRLPVGQLTTLFCFQLLPGVNTNALSLAQCQPTRHIGAMMLLLSALPAGLQRVAQNINLATHEHPFVSASCVLLMAALIHITNNSAELPTHSDGSTS